jgi:hypothetical protein
MGKICILAPYCDEAKFLALKFSLKGKPNNPYCDLRNGN